MITGRYPIEPSDQIVKPQEPVGWIVVDEQRIIWGISYDPEQDDGDLSFSWLVAYRNAVEVLDSMTPIKSLSLHRANLDLISEVEAFGGVIPWKFNEKAIAVHDPGGEPTLESLEAGE